MGTLSPAEDEAPWGVMGRCSSRLAYIVPNFLIQRSFLAVLAAHG